MTILRCFLVLLWLWPVTGEGQAVVTDASPPLQLMRVDTSATAPVVLGNDTLFFLRAGLKGLTVEKRADAVSRRIRETLAETAEVADTVDEGQSAENQSSGSGSDYDDLPF